MNLEELEKRAQDLPRERATGNGFAIGDGTTATANVLRDLIALLREREAKPDGLPGTCKESMFVEREEAERELAAMKGERDAWRTRALDTIDAWKSAESIATAALAEGLRQCEWYRTVIRTGGAMCRAERARMGIPGGIETPAPAREVPVVRVRPLGDAHQVMFGPVAFDTFPSNHFAAALALMERLERIAALWPAPSSASGGRCAWCENNAPSEPIDAAVREERAGKDSWRRANGAWQDWARDVLTEEGRQPASGEWGDGPARDILAGIIRTRAVAIKALSARIEAAVAEEREACAGDARALADKCRQELDAMNASGSGTPVDRSYRAGLNGGALTAAARIRARSPSPASAEPELDSPPFEPQEAKDLAARGFQRVNRHVAPAPAEKAADDDQPRAGEVSTSLLTPMEITIARAGGRLRVTPRGLGFVTSAVQPPAPVCEPSQAHAYTSTACHHEQHDRCRKRCKFCDVGCSCECHAAPVCERCGGSGWAPGALKMPCELCKGVRAKRDGQCGSDVTDRDSEHAHYTCALDAGHEGDHQGCGAQWTNHDAPVTPEAEEVRVVWVERVADQFAVCLGLRTMGSTRVVLEFYDRQSDAINDAESVNAVLRPLLTDAREQGRAEGLREAFDIAGDACGGIEASAQEYADRERGEGARECLRAIARRRTQALAARGSK